MNKTCTSGRLNSNRLNGIRIRIPIKEVTYKVVKVGNTVEYFLTTMEYKLQQITAMTTNKSPMLNDSVFNTSRDPCERMKTTPIMDKPIAAVWVDVSLSFNKKIEKIAMNNGVVEFTTAALIEVVKCKAK